LFTVLCGAMNSYAAVRGFDGIKRFSRYAVPGLIIFCLWAVSHLLLSHDGSLRLDYAGTGSLSYWQGMDLVIGGYIAGALAASDFTRHTSGNRANWMGVLPGAFFAV
jgi:purine-cytosine permease-like protein